MKYFLSQYKVFQQYRAAVTGFKLVLIIGNADALIGRQMAV